MVDKNCNYLEIGAEKLSHLDPIEIAFINARYI